ncbi:hypothetical protein [Streptomyces spongiae]|uniref:Apea-like HEPN domain-containing protein n=1 Tax=Streptomyces spongiae TaxID=565072 RepID=A0A5N8XWE8_9ACTN|nr:hypothetical protein [Streptomyces spongiae]MPY63689.1 hypothetical protein [Streptomyces spongiae]
MSSLPVLRRETVLEGLKWVFQGGESQDGAFILPTPAPLSGGRTIDRVTHEEIDSVLIRLSQAKVRTDSSVQWLREAEFSLLSLNDGGAFERLFEEKQFTGQGENPVTYSIGRPSPEFTAYLLSTAAQHPEIRKAPRWITLRHRVRNIIKDGADGRLVDLLTGDSLFDVAAVALFSTTLRVSCEKDRSDFEALVNAFLFHAAYNTDAAARVGLDPMFKRRSIQRLQRNQGSSFDAPRQTYEADLVHHYLMGVAAEIPLLEYLAYYHIAEHFFGQVFHDDLVKQVRAGITDPSFSARRAKDIQAIIRIVDKAQRQVKDEGGVNEQRALQLVLNRFVAVPRLICDLEAYDSSLVDYYANSDAAIAGASKVNLRMTDEDKVRGAAAKRIYKVRNALVHAKEGELPKYAPFAHDEELLREIPLMRFAAEQIMIAHGKAL